MVKHYTPTTLVLNMPVHYVAEDGGEILIGHFAYFDEDGAPYVWSSGGTSYTRTNSFDAKLDHANQVIKCSFVAPLSSDTEAVHRTNSVLEKYYSKKK